MMLLDRYGKTLSRILVAAEDYHPFPTASEREAWEALPRRIRSVVRSRAQGYLGFEWPRLPATLFLDYTRTGTRQRYEEPYATRRRALRALALAECVEGKGRFLDDIANGIWTICEESSWCIPAHQRIPLPDTSAPVIDLFAAETGSLLAWVSYLLRDQLAKVDPLLLERMEAEVRTRILIPFLTRNDFWWMGNNRRRRLNNWSPWCVSTCLAAVAIMEKNQRRRQDAVAKSLYILDRFLAGYHADGGCDEGPSYWGVAGGALFDCLEMLFSMTHGHLRVYDQPLIQEIGRYIYRAHISGDFFVNFADAPARINAPAGLIYRYGQRIGDDRMASFGSYLFRTQGLESLLGWSLLRALPNLFYTDGIGRRARAPLLRDVWLDGIHVMTAREREGSEQGLYLAAKGGHNAENHNHNDIGQFIVYSDGKPVLVDAGVGTYVRDTFSEQRYTIWTMRSPYHNLPTVNGVEQCEGEQYRATRVRYQQQEALAEVSFDLAQAYPEESGITSWRRTCRLDREASAVEITDDFILKQASRNIVLSLMTPNRPRLVRPGVIRLKAEDHHLTLAFETALEAKIEEIRLDDAKLRSAWGSTMYRLLLRPRRAVRQGVWTLRLTRAAARRSS